MIEPVETSELLAFARTVDAKSVSRAALELGVPRATVSRRLARLEERLGARLLRRTTRSLVLTDAGEAFYRHARIVLEAVHDAEASVRKTDAAIRGDLRISLPPMMNASFNDLLSDFAARYPDLRVHVHVSSRYVDLRREGYDVAIRAGSALEPGLVARTLARVPAIAVASPKYLAARGTPRTVRDLRNHRCLMGFGGMETPETYWPLNAKNKLHVEGSFFTNEIMLLAHAAYRGLGIAMLPVTLIRPLLEDGSLIQVLPGALGVEARVAIVYPEREFVPPQVRAFVDAVTAWAPGALDQGIPERCRTDLNGGESATHRSGPRARPRRPKSRPSDR
jgi:DNA-binding transcriptional LysR family regulator